MHQYEFSEKIHDNELSRAELQRVKEILIPNNN
jgi:hypothetical protein